MVELGIIAAMDKEANPLIEQMTDTVHPLKCKLMFTRTEHFARL